MIDECALVSRVSSHWMDMRVENRCDMNPLGVTVHLMSRLESLQMVLCANVSAAL